MKRSNFIKSIFLEYQLELKRYISQKLGGQVEAEEIVQDTFHNVLRSENPESIENPRAYLYKTAYNLALNRIRSQKHHENYLAQHNYSAEEAPSPERTVSALRDLEAVQNALDHLPQKCRQAFILSRVQSKTYSEIAEELNVSTSAVEKYMIRTLEYLREVLDKES